MDLEEMTVRPNIDESWLEALAGEFEKTYFTTLEKKLAAEKKAGVTVFPSKPEIFNAYNFTPFDQVKVVILGQDPYHGEGQAHGLCFSVQDGVKPPPSLKNIYKEMESDLGLKIPTGGNLSPWTSQGVFLLNAFLTVRKKEPASHRKYGWHFFTDATITALSEQRQNLVFMLWGNFAQKKSDLIDETKHLILRAPHPSPFSAYTGFFGSKHFTKANNYLASTGQSPINWNLNE